MKLLLFIAILAISQSLSAQRSALKYTGHMEVGMLNGNQQTNGYLQSSHGVNLGNTSATLGIGLDYYRIRSAPIYFKLTQLFGKGSTRPFIYASAGMNIPWPTDEQKVQRFNWWQQTSSTFQKGFYGTAGIGLSLFSKKDIQLAINAGWSYKSLTEKYMESVWDPWPQPTNSPTEKTLLYKFNTAKIGLAVIF